MTILIINTGIGNFEAIKNVLNHIGYKSKISSIDEDFTKYQKFIIPGVGSFDKAMQELKKHDGFNLLINKKFTEGKFFLGVCVGMQLLFDKSEEGNENGLSYIPGEIKKFKSDKFKIPHMGWNKVFGNKFFNELNDKRFYFAHSYYAECNDEYILAYSQYSRKFPAVVKNKNIYGIQFHPEKSNVNGINLIRKIISEKK